MTSRNSTQARRQTLMQERFRTLAYKELPDLERDGAYLLFSKKSTQWSPTGATVLLVDTHRGNCVRFEYVSAFLGNKIAEWLDAAFRDVPAPARLYSDGDRTINQGALVSWGAARGVSVVVHPACLLADAFSALTPSMVEVVQQATRDQTFEIRSQRFERWRTQYNSQLAMPDFRV